MEALDDLLSDTDCEGYFDRKKNGHFSFLALGKSLADKAPPPPLLAPFDEGDEGGAATAEEFEAEGVGEFSAVAAWGAVRPDSTRDGSTAAGSACSGDNDSDAGSCQRCPGRSLWDLSALGVTAAEEESQEGSVAHLEEEAEEEAEPMPALPCMSRIHHQAWNFEETRGGDFFEGSSPASRLEVQPLPSSSSTPRSSCAESGPPEAQSSQQPRYVEMNEGVANLEEIPISASGHYTTKGPASLPARPRSSGSATAAPPAAAPPAADGAAATAAAAPKPRPFLRKGTRMPRSDLPQSNGGPAFTKPIVNPSPKKPLRLRPRSSSQGQATAASAASAASAAPSPGPLPCKGEAVSEALLQGTEAPKASLRQEPGAPWTSGQLQEPLEVPEGDASSDALVQCHRGGGAGGGGGRAALPARVGGGGGGRGGGGVGVGAAQVGAPKRALPGALFQQPLELEPRKPASGSQASVQLVDPLEIVEDWGDSLAWESRAADELRCLADEVPTSAVVRSYFQRGPASATNRVPSRKDVQGSSCGAPPTRPQSQAAEPDCEVFSSDREDAAPADPDDGVRQSPDGEDRLKALEREREELKRMQARAAQSERDVARERQKLLQEVEAERQALHMEFDAERTALRKERRRLGQGAERQRQQLAEDREMVEERRRLQDRTEQLEEEMREKERRWQRTVDRLQRQITDLTRKNQELQDEVRRSNQEAHRAQHRSSGVAEVPRRSASAVSMRGRRASTPTPKAAVQSGRGTTNTGFRSGTPTTRTPLVPGSALSLRASKSPQNASEAEVAAGCGLTSAQLNLETNDSFTALEDTSLVGSVSREALPVMRVVDSAQPGSACSAVRDEVHKQQIDSEVCPCEVRNLDGKTERTFEDGHREVEFANGLRKVMWPDGRSSVMFQNGDQKEIHPDGTIVYHYSATGAVQTTLPDGSDLFRFRDGQFEQHNPDGSKEIRFANGTTKLVFIDGSEEICFTDGTVRRTSCTIRPGA